MKKLILPFLTLFLASNFCFGQTSAAFERAAANSFADGNYFGAMSYYEKMLVIDSSDAKGLMGFADAARMQGAFDEAEKAYQKIYDSKSKNRDPRAAYFLGGIKQDKGQYEDAKMRFEEYLANSNTTDTSYAALARERMKQCDYAIRHKGETDLEVEITRFPEPINTRDGEYAPHMVGDILYFSSNRDEFSNDKNYPKRQLWKVFNSKMGQNGSETTKGDFNEADLHTANASFSPDGNSVFYSVCKYVTDSKIECKLFRREKLADGSFGNANILPEPINSPVGSTTTEPNVAVDADGNDVLLFSSNRPGGKGGNDIYSTRILKDGTFTNPENLSVINSIGDDISPNWHRKSNTLYFATNGRPSLGGFDIFKSEFKMGNWKSPVHLASPTNSSYNDAFYHILPDETGALFASNRPELGTQKMVDTYSACCMDIFKAEYLGLDLDVFTFHKIKKDSLRGTTVRLIELDENKKIVEDIKVDLMNSAFTTFSVNRDKSYMLIAEKADFTLDTTYFTTIGLPRTTRKLTQKLYLQPAEIDLTAFVFNKLTGKPLLGTTLKFEEILGGSRSESKDNLVGNDYFYGLNFSRQYRITASKVGYSTETVTVSTQGFDRFVTRHLTEKLYLEPRSIEEYLPVAVFFDNDEPDKRVNRATTTTTYGYTYERYYPRKAPFVAGWNAANPSQNQAQNVGLMTMDEFFEQKVRGGWEKLQLVSTALNERLAAGAVIQLVIKGFASPRAATEYNKLLTGRRVWSLKNHFATWNNGQLNAYILDNKLQFVEEKYGEDTAPKDIIDNIQDEKNSVYSLRASYERRVEIVEIKMITAPATNGK
jgi:hypothetical protein